MRLWPSSGAFEFLESIGEQIEALRTTLQTQIKDAPRLRALGISVGAFDEDSEPCNSGWAFRTNIDTFELYLARKKGRKVPIIFGALQVSIGLPSSSHSEARRDFFPHVAVLLLGNPQLHGWTQWKCEEFRLDAGFLESDSEEPWVRRGERRWEYKDGTPAVALVIPLVDLRDERDSETKVVVPLFEEVARMLTAT